MNEMNQNAQAVENKVVVSYIVSRFENGDIRVENNPVEGITLLSNEALYKDLEDVAKTIENRRIENAAYRGIYRFYADMEARERAAAMSGVQQAEPTIDFNEQ